jgi:predicted MPP superfamily phosphohydrolase
VAALRFVPVLLVLLAVQVGLWSALCALFLPRAEQAPQRRKLALALAGLALFFVCFMIASRSGLQLSAALREFLVEPLLAVEVLSIPLMLLLGVSLSVARRFPKITEPGELAEPRRIFLRRATTGLIGATGAVAALGIEQAELAPQLTRHRVGIRGLHPDLDGVTLLQLSDIHAGSLMPEERMLRIARAAAALQPDIVVLTGDLLDVSPRAAAPFSRAFGELRGKLGTFCIFGNHDYFAGPRAAEAAVRDAGAVLLRNSGARIERGRGSLFIGGVDDPSSGGLGVDPARALRAAAPEEPRIMLAHRPSLFELCANAGAQLVLSGHTHGGQIALSPEWSLARLLGPYTMGLYQRAGAHLYVHRGMGTVGPVPVRLGSPPEIALLTLRRV